MEEKKQAEEAERRAEEQAKKEAEERGLRIRMTDRAINAEVEATAMRDTQEEVEEREREEELEREKQEEAVKVAKERKDGTFLKDLREAKGKAREKLMALAAVREGGWGGGKLKFKLPRRGGRGAKKRRR